jgi:hypothetical protein
LGASATSVYLKIMEQPMVLPKSSQLDQRWGDLV